MIIIIKSLPIKCNRS